jgi:hypothetical protein
MANAFNLVPLLSLLLLWAPDTWAQGAGANKAAAEALFEQAKALAAEQRFAEACPKFEASQQLDPGLGTLLHLADCHERQGKLATAWALFEEAAATADNRGESARGQVARVRAAALQPQLIRLVVEVPAELPPGFELKRNGVAVPPGAYGAPVPIDAGTWLLRATAPGYEPFEASVTLDASNTEPYHLRILDLTRTPSSTPAAVPSEPSSMADTTNAPGPTDQSSGSQKTLGLIIGSGGVIAGVVSGIFTVMASSSNANSKDFCDPRDANLCLPQGVKERDEALSQATIATGAAIIGVVGVGVGATLFLTAPDARGNGAAMLKVGGAW